MEPSSLEESALLNIVTTLWSEDDILDLLARFEFLPIGFGNNERWKHIESKVLEKALLLSLPVDYEERVLILIKPIGLEILKWMECHCNNPSFSVNLPRKFCWTSQGTIDKKSTAKVLLRDESLSVLTRFRLACIYCILEYIVDLWYIMPQNTKNFLLRRDTFLNGNEQELVIFWIHVLKQDGAGLIADYIFEDNSGNRCSFYKIAFDAAAESGNKAAAEFLWPILTDRQKSDCLVKIATFLARRKYFTYEGYSNFHIQYCPEMVCFLISNMTEEQQIEMFKTCPYDVLMCFLDWSLKDFFVEVANCMQSYLSERNCLGVLKVIISKAKYEYKHCGYEKLFGKFWEQLSYEKQRFVIDNCLNEILYNLLQLEDEENVKLVLQSCNLAEKRAIAFTNSGHVLCQYLIFSNNWHLLKVLLREVISSNDEMIEFNRKIKDYLTQVYLDLELNPEIKYLWDKIIQQVNELVYDWN